MDRTRLIEENPAKFGGKTYATLVIDRSGSMDSVRDDTIGGINQWKNGLAQTDPNALVTIVQFDHEYDVLYAGARVSDVPDFSRDTYVPRGSTALLDAINKALVLTDTHLTENDRAIFAVVTDGEENASKEIRSASIIRSAIKQREERGNYTFAFLNSSPDKFLSQSLGFRHDNSYFYAGASPVASRQAFENFSAATMSYAGGSKSSVRGLFHTVDDENEDTTVPAGSFSAMDDVAKNLASVK
jgi:hypothetical protein